MGAALLYAMQAFNAIPQILSTASTLETAFAAVKDHIDTTNAALQKMHAENRDPTADEWVALSTSINGLRSKLHS